MGDFKLKEESVLGEKMSSQNVELVDNKHRGALPIPWGRKPDDEPPGVKHGKTVEMRDDKHRGALPKPPSFGKRPGKEDKKNKKKIFQPKKKKKKKKKKKS